MSDVRAALAAGADVNWAGGLPLRSAAWNGAAATARLLLEHGADVNAGTAELRGRFTALHAAAQSGYPEVLRVLLAAGANVHIASNGRTALCCAAQDGANLEHCAKLLLAHGAHVDGSGEIPKTPLWWVIDRDYLHDNRDLVKIFLRAGARAIADADLPRRSSGNEAAIDLHNAVRAAGGWPEYVAAHRGVLAGLVAKLSAKGAVPLDAAGHVVAFYCPPGGF